MEDERFQANLFISKAAFGRKLGMSPSEIDDDLRKALYIRVYRTNETPPSAYRTIAQNVSLSKHHTRPFGQRMNALMQFPFTMAR